MRTPSTPSWLFLCWELAEGALGTEWPEMVTQWKRKSHGLRDFHRDRWSRKLAARIYREDPQHRRSRAAVFGLLTVEVFFHRLQRDRKPAPLSPLELVLQALGPDPTA